MAAMRNSRIAATATLSGLALTLLLGGVASAQATIVIESVVGQESSDVDRYLPDVVKGLESPLTRSGASLGADIDAHFGPSPGRLSSSAVAELQARLKQAERSVFLTGTHVREGIDDMEDVRTRLEEALWTLAHNADARALYQSVLLKLARAYQVNTRLPDAAKLAQARMEAIVRYFQDAPPDVNRIEKELADLFTSVKKQLPNTSSLKINSVGVVEHIYINGADFSSANTKLPTGEYRYFVSGPHGDGRVHKVTLGAGVRKSDFVDLDFESALRTDAFVGFAFSNSRDRDRSERESAVSLGRALKASEVVVLKEVSINEKPLVVASAYRTLDGALTGVGTQGAAGVVPGEQLRRVAQRLRLEELAIEGKADRPTPAQDQAAGFVVLASANRLQPKLPNPDERVVAPPVAELPAPQSQPERLTVPTAQYDDDDSSKRLAKAAWGLLGAAVPISIVGWALYAREYLGTCESPTHLCVHQYNDGLTGIAGNTLVGVGAALGGLSLMFNVRAYIGPTPLKDIGIELAVMGATTLIGGGIFYQPSNIPIAFERQPNGTVAATTLQTVRHQGTDGIILMGAGAGVTAIGSTLILVDQFVLRPRRQKRERALAIAPSLSPTFAGLSLGGRF
jgi:hypothetical protein